MGRRRPRTHRRLRQIARALADWGLTVSANTVRRLLDQLGIALRGTCKELSSGSGPQRDRQFCHIARQRRGFVRKAQPIISVDTKKKELVGCFKNPGRCWSAQPVRVKDHDFRSQALGMAIPYGIYDLQANRGSIYVGTTHDTPQFAVESIGQWWRRQGKPLYGADSHLLILADGGGSNGYQCRAWKWALQEHLVDPCRLPVTVCHYPTGASKWNPIHHQEFPDRRQNLRRTNAPASSAKAPRTTSMELHSLASPKPELVFAQVLSSSLNDRHRDRDMDCQSVRTGHTKGDSRYRWAPHFSANAPEMEDDSSAHKCITLEYAHEQIAFRR